MRTFRFLVVCICLASILYQSDSISAESLSIRNKPGSSPHIIYDNQVVFGYGPSPQNILTFLPTGNGNDYVSWIKWASKYKMNHVRSYPPSIIVKPPSINLFHRSLEDKSKFDLTKFNQDYFEELHRACLLMKQKGFFVHLQLWQAVAWKKQWDINYYNPINNINSKISAHAGPGEFMVLDNRELLKHQKLYVRKILDATARLGNVYFDIANEIGNGTGSSVKWVLEILNTIRQWEQNNAHQVLVTINGRGGNRVRNIEEVYRVIDLIVKDVGKWEEHVDTQSKFFKPTVSVRNIDWDYEDSKRAYFYGQYNLEVNTDHKLQVRGRKYWWRMFMAKVQMAGAYADAYDRSSESLVYKIINKIRKTLGLKRKLVDFQSSYQLNTLSEENFVRFRSFVEQITDYSRLLATKEVGLDHPAAHHYTLQSDREVVIYIESPNGRSGYQYPEKAVTLTGLELSDGTYSLIFYFPGDGRALEQSIQIRNGGARFLLPEFSDDLAIHIQNS